MSSASVHPPPRGLRGLNPARLLGVLGGPPRTSPPEIPGWRIRGVAGEGGEGIVWRAERITDATLAAIKSAPSGDPDSLERIEREAETLRGLRHPNIVGLLESEPVGDDGLYLAMEFIDGPVLAQEIPAAGFPPARAVALFRQIAAGVAHAHDAGILHRDLKPGNILLAPDCTAKVADFGLARPVHQRVQQLSLTRAGIVAGTAEYLPPEAYQRDYRPNLAADIFALGVILHELLTGAPPRGHWRPASSRPGVDVRLDRVIARAMDENPSHRWPDVRSMLAALDAALVGPPRYSGIPLVTFAVRVTDCLWTILGGLVLLAATSSHLHLMKARMVLPFDLIGSGGRLTGSFQALFILLLMTVPLAVWQLVRLRRFRHTPLREALPSPFGLDLGSGPTGAMLVAAAQLLFLWLPAGLLLALFLSCGLTWLQPHDPPWTHGLAVTPMADVHQIISPWQAAQPGKGYWLHESHGPPGHGLASPVDRISFFPRSVPVLMVAAAGLLGLALLATTVIACRQWWQRQRRRRSAAVGAATATALVMACLAWSGEARVARDVRHPLYADPLVAPAMTAHLHTLAAFLLGEPGAKAPAQDWTAFYAEAVDYRHHGTVRREEIPRLLAASRPAAASSLVEIIGNFASWQPTDGSFVARVHAVEAFHGPDRADPCGADDLCLELHGTVTRDGRTTIRTEKLVRTPMYRADLRTATVAEARAWLRDFLHTVATGAADPAAAHTRLATLIQTVPGALLEGDSNGWLRHPLPWHSAMPAMLGAELLLGADATPTLAGLQPGGRTRLILPFTPPHPHPPRTLVADLIHSGGHWRCVRLRYGRL